MGINAAAAVLVSGLSSILHVAYTPMPDMVARLDTSGQEWVLHLDPDSPAEDHCWAMLDMLHVLILGRHAAGSALPAPRLHLVQD